MKKRISSLKTLEEHPRLVSGEMVSIDPLIEVIK